MSTGPSAPPASQPAAASDVTCPLCGVPLEVRQDWCLRCGAAARTRLAASVGWRAPLISLAVVIVLSLVVLAGALVKLAGDSNGSGSTAPGTVTATVPATAPAGAVTEGVTAGPSSTIPSTPATTAPATGAPSGATGAQGALGTAGSVAAPSPNSANPSTAKAKP
jgi:hypothetical protein